MARNIGIVPTFFSNILISTWKNDSNISSHGNIMEFLNFEKYHGKFERKPGKIGISIVVNTLFSFLSVAE